MNISPEYIEYLHKRGLLPDRYYYQINGHSAQENYNNQREKIKGQFSAPQIEIDKEELQKQIESTIQDILENLKID